jgi:hypothetical protein
MESIILLPEEIHKKFGILGFDLSRFTLLLALAAIELYLLTMIWVVPTDDSRAMLEIGTGATQICRGAELRRWWPIFEITMVSFLILSVSFVVYVFFNTEKSILLGTGTVFLLLLISMTQLLLATVWFPFRILRSDCTIASNVRNWNFIRYKIVFILLLLLLGALSPFSKLVDSI